MDSQDFLLLAYCGTELGIWQRVPTTVPDCIVDHEGLYLPKLCNTCILYTIVGCVKQLAPMLLYLL